MAYVEVVLVRDYSNCTMAIFEAHTNLCELLNLLVLLKNCDLNTVNNG